MASDRNNNNYRVSDLWKWAAMTLATFLAGLLIAGIPFVLRTPTAEEVKTERDRLGMVLERLAAIEVRLTRLEEDGAREQARLELHIQENTRQVEQLRAELVEHERKGTK